MKKIAIIGGGYLQLPLVLKANEMGYQTYCFAYLDGAICQEHCTRFYDISIVHKEEILAVCEELGIDAVTTISSDLAVATVNYIGEKLGLTSNPNKHTEITTNKFKMKEVFHKNKIPLARFVLCKTEQDLEKTELLNYPLIVKPVDRSGSLGVTKIDSVNDLNSALQKAKAFSISCEVIVEEFIEGHEVSVETISQNGSHVILAITDKVTTGAPYFVELEHHQPSSLPEDTLNKIESVVISALNSLEIQVGASHTELIISYEGELYLNEIGARMGGDFIGSDLVELSTGYDYLNAVLDLSLGKPLQIEVQPRRHSGVIFRTPSNSELFDSISGNEEFVVRLEKNKRNKNEFQKSGDRGNYFIYQHDKRVKLAEV
jgi:biotin carboxylase